MKAALDSFLQFVGKYIRGDWPRQPIVYSSPRRIEGKTYEKHRPRRPTKSISPELCFDILTGGCVFTRGKCYHGI